MRHKGISFILPIVSLLALIAGGIFVFRSWQTTVYVSYQPLEQELVLEASIEEEGEEIETVMETEKIPVKEEFNEKIQELIRKSEDLITQAQKFIKEEQEKW